MTIKFNLYNVTDGTHKARCFYSLDNRCDERKCVTIYARDYGSDLGKMFDAADYKNDTDSMTDYFDEGRVVLFEDHPMYEHARARVEAHHATFERKQAAKQQARRLAAAS